jgi:MFS family permease
MKPNTRAWLNRGWILTYPGLVAIIGFAPVGILGPLIFAIRDDMSMPTSVLGVTFAVFFIASSITSSLGAVILSRISPAGVVRAGLASSALLCFVLAFATSSMYFIVVATVAGLINGVTTPGANLVLVQTIPLKRQGLGFGLKVAAVPVASSLASLGAVIVATSGISWRLIYMSFGLLGLMLLSTALVRCVRRGTVSTTRRQMLHRGRPPRALVMLAAGGLFAALGTALYPAFLVDSLLDRGLPPGGAAAMVGVIGWLGIAARIVIGGLADSLPRPIAHIQGVVVLILIAAAGMLGLAFGSSELVLGVAVFACLCLGWAWPGLLHHAVMGIFPGRAAMATSYVQTGNYIGTVAGVLAFGFVAEFVSFTVAWFVPIVAVLVGAALLLAAIRELRRGSTTHQ